MKVKIRNLTLEQFRKLQEKHEIVIIVNCRGQVCGIKFVDTNQEFLFDDEITIREEKKL